MVAGFYRSGTSLVCRLLDRVGLFLGYELVGFEPLDPRCQSPGLDEVQTSEVFDSTVTDRRSGKQPISNRGLIDRIDATWQALEQPGKHTERMMKR